MNTSNFSNTETLIVAARALAARQQQDLHFHVAIADAELQCSQTSGEVEQAEMALATAEAALAEARLAKLVAQRRLSTVQLQLQQVAPLVEAARQKLWGVCSSPDETVIVAAALAYGKQTHILWLAQRETAHAQTALDQAETSIARTEAEVQSCKAALRQCREAHIAASQAFQGAHENAVAINPGFDLFDLERAVADAAHELTGTLGERCAYSYVETKDLPVWQSLLDAAARQ